MIIKILKNKFDPYYNASVEDWKKIVDLYEEVHFEKNEIIKESNKVASYGYFLWKGAVGTFVRRKNSFACLNLILEHNIFADDYSLATELPTPLEIVALEESTVFRISRLNIDSMKNIPSGKTIYIIGEEIEHAKKQKRQMDLMTKSAKERYLEIMKNQPQLLQRISQKHIASFLGITTQSLSRIRRNISHAN